MPFCTFGVMFCFSVGDKGQDAEGLLKEWYVIISREIFKPIYALFKSSPGDRVTYTINDFSHINSNHLCYFKFVGRVIAKAIYDNKLLKCYFKKKPKQRKLEMSIKLLLLWLGLKRTYPQILRSSWPLEILTKLS